MGYGVWFPVAITLLTRSRRPSSAEARCWRPAGVLCLLRGCEVLPRLARCQPRASAQWQGLEDLAAPWLWAQGLLVGQTAPLLSASGLRQEQAGVRPRESAKQAVWALVFVSVAAGATLPPTHPPCRPAGPRHSGWEERRGSQLTGAHTALPTRGETWRGMGAVGPVSSVHLLTVKRSAK